MPRNPIFVIDTNVFVHASNCKGEGTTPMQAKVARTVISFLIAKCYPFLFSNETLKELKWKFNKLHKKKEFMQFDIIREVNQNILYVKDTSKGNKAHFGEIYQKKDEIEEIISDPSDRKFIYLLRDYVYTGKKFLISSDKSAFFPTNPEIKNELKEYQTKNKFKILSPANFVVNLDIIMMS